MKKGHLAKKCHQHNKTGTCKLPHSKSTYHIGTDTDKEAEDCVYTMFTIPSAKQDLIQITVDVENYPLAMELDTRTALSIISETVYKTYCQPQNWNLLQLNSRCIQANQLRCWVPY